MVEIRRQQQRGFALPTVLIASVVLMTVLAVSVSSVASVRITLKEQYYEQLAKVAGEAGVAYAKACLAKNGNVPLWTNAKPLTPATDCAGNVVVSPCPASAGCSVVSNQDLRSSFRVKLPALDSDGKAVTIPNSGYVELLRHSDGTVWRVYTQPGVQPVVVPDLCSGAATTSQGWANAARATSQQPLTGASAAVTIAPASSDTAPGVAYFRKDFSVTDESASYVFQTATPESYYTVNAMIDGAPVLSGSGQQSASLTLDNGCHTIEVSLTSNTLVPSPARFTAALRRSGAEAPIVVTDTSWRVNVGDLRQFSESGYIASSAWWSNATDMGVLDTWLTATPGDYFTRLIGSVSSNPGYLYLRDYKDVILTDNTDVKVRALCDDNCVVYMDGRPILNESLYPNIFQSTLTITAGSHRFGAVVYNQATGRSGIMLSVTRLSDNKVINRTDSRWQIASVLDSSPKQYSSYNSDYLPSPSLVARPATVDVIVVAGGGGGGGNGTSAGGAGGGGGGGVVITTTNATLGASTVTVGAGGAGGPGASLPGAGLNGGNSSFGSIVAYGGGGGARQNGLPGGNGGSGGGGSGGASPLPGAGGAGTAGQGSNGGAGANLNDGNYNGGGGGGAGGYGLKGTLNPAGAGGSGVILFYTGVPMILGAGGGAGTYSSYNPGSADLGGGGGGGISVNNGNGYPGLANTGGGGGGANGNNRGGSGGAGGSGVVIIRYKTGTITATGGTITTVNGYTVHTFTTSGTFNVTALAS